MKAFHPLISYIINSRFDREPLQELAIQLIGEREDSFFDDHIPSYDENSDKAANKIAALFEQTDPNIHITRNFKETDIPLNSIAYHRIFGPILADDEWKWYFSTKRFMSDVIAAEQNSRIIAHFAHVNSGGGEAWMLEKAYEVVAATQKPFHVFIEKKAASAAYYLISPANVINSYTVNDTIGSIGTMVAFWDIIPYFIKEGFNWVEEYAHKSDLKNKKFNDLTDGKPEQYITEELDPLQQQFEANVRKARTKLAKLPEDDPVFKGETFDAVRAREIGLIDNITELETAIRETYQAGMNISNRIQSQARALSLI